VADQWFDIDAYERRSREGPCFVCLIADGAKQRTDNEVIFEDDEVLVFLDRYPTVEGYVLVCPRRHVEHVTGDFSEDEYAALQRWVHRVGEALRRSVPTERLYVLSLASQQGNRHVHWHVVAQPPGLAVSRTTTRTPGKVDSGRAALRSRAEQGAGGANSHQPVR
jgi:diadenosine tetraphosphate (Ap4A) HIT family hydrolase